MVHSIELNAENINEFVETNGYNFRVFKYADETDLPMWALFVLSTTKPPEIAFGHVKRNISTPCIFDGVHCFPFNREVNLNDSQFFSTLDKRASGIGLHIPCVILYYRATCIYCKNMRNAWNATVQSFFFNRTCEFFACEYTEYTSNESDSFAPLLDIRSFPTIHRISHENGGRVVRVFDNKLERTTAHLTSFAKGHAMRHVGTAARS